MNDNMDSTQQMDDMPQVAEGPSEQELFDAVMRNSPMMEGADVPLPEETVDDEDPDEVVDADPETTEDVSDEDNEPEEAEEDIEDEDAGDEPATQEADVFTADDLDLEAMVRVKIDGEEQDVSFGDLLKGYQTDSHLSKKGRELGEAQKQLEAERAEKLGELDKISAATAQILTGAEEQLAKEYHELEAKIKEARENGDTFELSDLKDKREQVQQNYWTQRKQREQLIEAVDKQKEEARQATLNEQIQHFQKVIPDLIPGFDEKVAGQIRDFALEEGISEELLGSVVDPGIVKFIDDYRRLKQGVKKGTAKRKAVPAKKALPTKKAPTQQKKAKAKEDVVRQRAFSDDASSDDHMAFLRSYASKSLGG